VYSSLREPITEVRSVTCHTGSHSVTWHPTQVNALTPQQGRQGLQSTVMFCWKQTAKDNQKWQSITAALVFLWCCTVILANTEQLLSTTYGHQMPSLFFCCPLPYLQSIIIMLIEQNTDQSLSHAFN